MHQVVFGLGSNYGDRSENVSKAIEWLSGLLIGTCVSDIYETPAYGHAGAPYMNAVVSGTFTGPGDMETLQQACKDYEVRHGRDVEARKLNHVPIDIDIVIDGDKILRAADFSRSFFQKGYQQIIQKP